MRVKFSNNKYIHYSQQANYARLINRCTYTFRLLQGYIAERRMPNKELNAERRNPKALFTWGSFHSSFLVVYKARVALKTNSSDAAKYCFMFVSEVVRDN